VGEDEKKLFIANHFMQFFTAGDVADGIQKQQVFDAVEPCVTPAMNERLCLVPNFGAPKFIITFRLYLVIIVQSLTN
jgi:hypothetical protein